MDVGVVVGTLFKQLGLNERERSNIADIIVRFEDLLSYHRDYRVAERKLSLAEIAYILDAVARCIRGWIQCDTRATLFKRVFLFEYEENEKPYPVLAIIDFENEKVYYVEPEE